MMLCDDTYHKIYIQLYIPESVHIWTGMAATIPDVPQFLPGSESQVCQVVVDGLQGRSKCQL